MTRLAMGTEFQVLLAGDDERALEGAANHALDEVERLDGQMSLYRPDSELCWINAHAAERPVPAEPGLFGLLQQAREIWQATDGAFDVTVGPLIECWGFFRGQGKMPPEDAIDEALDRVGMQHVDLDVKQRTVHFRRPGIRIDLGGIAKGFAIDEAVESLRQSSVAHALIHGGRSSVFGLGESPGGDGWPVGIRHPFDPKRRLLTLRLAGRALSTSGSYEKSFEHEGVVYSHILDPRTGWPVQGMLSASATTETAAEGDAVSTAFFVMGVEKTGEYCRARPHLGAILVPQPAESDEPEAIELGRVPRSSSMEAESQ